MNHSTADGRRATPQEPIVYVVDDDPAVRDALSSLFRSVGLQVATFASAPQLVAQPFANAPSCIVLDIRMPEVSGLDFQAQLARIGNHIPVIFMTGHGDIPMSVRAMKAGAVDFLTKPFRDQDLLDAVSAAIERDRQRRGSDHQLLDLRRRFESLTAREKEVMGLVVKGLMNKQIAGELNLSEITVKIHRGRMMKKMEIRTLADLVRAASDLQLAPRP
ncbi:response regulator transcription factor [Segnochrobactrum spirostomi]|uniref:Response regulator transcription factor n=1 Tax=Segnochrobactrum spirostomi TaxID=2608987 RepID=A0A6A7Y837_9HYPH|nr:response regulator transcription factor [Segnochrobactrum spirostomi]MQT15026.1 response regulator transcription factor [Segnochrobactrum spirostomi]